jgi:hypothetical protein
MEGTEGGGRGRTSLCTKSPLKMTETARRRGDPGPRGKGQRAEIVSKKTDI